MLRRALLVLASILAASGSFPPASTAAEGPAPSTPAYREAFGPTPRTEAPESCLAAVVFLPGVGRSGGADRLSALPLFLLDPDRVLEHAAGVLVEGYPISLRFFEPPRVFPPGSRFLGVEREGATAVLRVALEAGTVLGPIAAQAAAHTLAQFPGVEAAAVAVDGGARGPAVKPDATLLEPPPPPRFLDVAAPYHEGEEPRDIHVLFDRPVAVDAFRLRLDDGTAVPGQAYLHAFDMAVVFRPSQPVTLREGLRLQVSWSVTDRAGRVSREDHTVGLRLYEQHE
ncbi:MAG: hypothetical protein SCH98_16790 [Deferrisomatales bacterium]|nr:hypothetical protein [Deferrisomatales bacterium]